jgi:hypothetical protein
MPFLKLMCIYYEKLENNKKRLPTVPTKRIIVNISVNILYLYRYKFEREVENIT